MELNESIELLHNRLALIDLMSKQSSRNGLEFLILKKEKMKIKMYQEIGHSMPHVHIDFGELEHQASYSIKDEKRLVGDLPKKYEKELLSWIAENKSSLLTLWSEAQAGKPTDELILAIKEASKK